MKAFLIIIGSILLALALRVVDMLTSGKNTGSFGHGSNESSGEHPTIDIFDQESIRLGLEHYKNLDE